MGNQALLGDLHPSASGRYARLELPTHCSTQPTHLLKVRIPLVMAATISWQAVRPKKWFRDFEIVVSYLVFRG